MYTHIMILILIIDKLIKYVICVYLYRQILNYLVAMNYPDLSSTRSLLYARFRGETLGLDYGYEL